MHMLKCSHSCNINKVIAISNCLQLASVHPQSRLNGIFGQNYWYSEFDSNWRNEMIELFQLNQIWLRIDQQRRLKETDNSLVVLQCKSRVNFKTGRVTSICTKFCWHGRKISIINICRTNLQTNKLSDSIITLW